MSTCRAVDARLAARRAQFVHIEPEEADTLAHIPRELAAPVLGLDGRPVAAMSICGPVERFRDEVDTAAELLPETTRSMSKQMGYSGR